MTTLDRYVVRTFVTSVLLWFVVLMAIRVMADLLFNLDEFAETGETLIGRLQWIGTYYGYQSVLYFAELGGVIVVVAAVFSLARMNYTNELTAILASGVSLYRVLFPIVIGSIVISGLIFVDREFLIPRISHRLVRDRDSDTIREFTIPLRVDEHRTAWYARKFYPAQDNGNGIMDSPRVVLRSPELQPSVAVTASRGRRPTKAEKQRLDVHDGWILEGATVVHAGRGAVGAGRNCPTVGRVFTSISRKAILKEINEQQAAGTPEADLVLSGNTDEDNGVILHGSTGFHLLQFKDGQYNDLELEEVRFDLWVSERTGEVASPVRTRIVGSLLADRAVWREHVKDTDPDAHWALTNGVLFIPTDLDARKLTLRQSSSWLDFLALRDVTKLLTLDQTVGAKEAELTMHVRMTEPVYNVLLLLLGVPFILSRERNIKTSAGMCLLLCMSCFMFIYVCKHISMPPAFRAWVPLMVFGPIAAVTVDSIKT